MERKKSSALNITMHDPKIESIYENILRENNSVNSEKTIRHQLMKLIGNHQSILLGLDILLHEFAQGDNSKIVEKLLEIKQGIQESYDKVETYFQYWK